jgi:hypothetical protein
MNCEWAQKQLTLFLYGELPPAEARDLREHLDACQACRRELERERAAHAAAESIALQPEPDLLNRCRRELSARLHRERNRPALWAWLGRWVGFGAGPWAAFARPAGALALVALGFFAGARYTTLRPPAAPSQIAAGQGPLLSKIRYVQPEPSGNVEVAVDETRERIVTGRPGDQQIRSLLLAAAKDPADPGLRVDSLDILKSGCDSAEVRTALAAALRQDPNSGARLKALEGLKRFPGDPEVRAALTQALLSDDNPGIRIQAIDLLIDSRKQAEAMVSVLQQVTDRDDNNYIRLRCQKALREMNASVGTF